MEALANQKTPGCQSLDGGGARGTGAREWVETILRQGAKHQGVQVCPGGERQEVEPEDLELRRGSDGAGTEKEILEPGKRVYPWSLITSKGRAEAVSLGTAVGCVVTWLKVTGSCQPLLGVLSLWCTHLHTSRIPGSEEQQRKSCSGHLLCSFFFLCWGSPAPDLKRDLSLISWRITLPLPERTTSGTSEHISWLPFRAPWHLNHTECYKYRAIHVCF